VDVSAEKRLNPVQFSDWMDPHTTIKQDNAEGDKTRAVCKTCGPISKWGTTAERMRAQDTHAEREAFGRLKR
jgi:hypothetical protein